jgi:hypothetical protein
VAGKDPKRHESMGERAHHAEEAVEHALKDAVAEVENRLLIAGGAADNSTSGEVNLLSAAFVAVDPPDPNKPLKARKPKAPAKQRD